MDDAATMICSVKLVDENGKDASYVMVPDVQITSPTSATSTRGSTSSGVSSTLSPAETFNFFSQPQPPSASSANINNLIISSSGGNNNSNSLGTSSTAPPEVASATTVSPTTNSTLLLGPFRSQTSNRGGGRSSSSGPRAHTPTISPAVAPYLAQPTRPPPQYQFYDATANPDITAPGAGYQKTLEGTLISSSHMFMNLDGRRGVYFVFSDILVRVEGSYRLKFELHDLKRYGFLSLST